jgi:DNA-binding transcriptional ArsR family regulator
MVQYSQPHFDTSFGALSDATRRGVLEELGRADASITALAERFHMTLTGMKKHIGILEQVGLITTEKVGRVRTCKLGNSGLEEEAAWIEGHRQLWAARFDELDLVAEELKLKEKQMEVSRESESTPTKNPTTNFPSSEIEAFEHFICGFTGGILRRAREIPEKKWNWSFSERTPTAREICEHSWMWLRSDRQEITVLDPTCLVAIPDTPQHRAQMLDLLESEKEAWRELIQTVTAPMMDELRTSPDGHCRSVRGCLFHMAQHIVSKSGQMTMLHFELGLDGGEAYDAPHPNRLFGFGSPAWPTPRN